MNIVSLLPSTTEICYALGLGSQLRGVTHECDFPEEARRLPHLTRNVLPPGEHSSADIDRMIAERILNGLGIYELDRCLLAALDPDLILTQQLCAVCAVAYDEVLDAVAELPTPPVVASFEPRSVAEILASIERIAELAGIPEHGTEVTGALRERVARVVERVSGNLPATVVCLEWLDPPMVGGHWVPEMVRLAGGLDLLGPEGGPSVRVNWSQIEAADPDAIVVMPCGYDLPTTLVRGRELDRVDAWRALRAVREGCVYAVDGSGHFNRPGPRIVAGIELLAHLLHGPTAGFVMPSNLGVRLSSPGARE